MNPVIHKMFLKRSVWSYIFLGIPVPKYLVTFHDLHEKYPTTLHTSLTSFNHESNETYSNSMLKIIFPLLLIFIIINYFNNWMLNNIHRMPNIQPWGRRSLPYPASGKILAQLLTRIPTVQVTVMEVRSAAWILPQSNQQHKTTWLVWYYYR